MPAEQTASSTHTGARGGQLLSDVDANVGFLDQHHGVRPCITMIIDCDTCVNGSSSCHADRSSDAPLFTKWAFVSWMSVVRFSVDASRSFASFSAKPTRRQSGVRTCVLQRDSACEGAPGYLGCTVGA